MSWCSDVRHIKKTRKKHVCVYCGRTIPVGKPAESWFFAAGGDSGAVYACIPCRSSKLIDVGEYYEDEFIYGTLHDFLCNSLYEFNTCPICGERHDNWDWTDDGDIEFECEDCEHKWVVPYGWE